MKRPDWFPKPMGRLSARVHGGRNALRDWATSALAASREPGIDERFAASLRGKAHAYAEAERVLAAIENGTRIPGPRGAECAHADIQRPASSP